MTLTFDINRALKNVAGHARRAQALTGVPGIAIAIVSDETIAFAQTGSTTAGGSTLINSDTVFQLASLSKPIATTIAAWQLSHGATWGWDAAIARELPGFSLANQAVTVGALFAHRSGLPDHAGDLLEDMGYGHEEILRRLSLLPLSPGHIAPSGRFVSSYAYTNFGFTAAALAVARAGGCDWPVLAERVLYQALGMTSTSSRFSAFEAALRAGTAAVPHQRTPAPLAGTPPLPANPSWQATSPVRNADAQSPAGGVCSTTRDLAQWLRLQLGLINDGHFDGAFRAQLALTHQPYLPSSTGYGFGWNVDLGSDGSDGQPPRPVRWSHSGAFELGAATAVMLLPQCQTGIVVLTNGQPIGVPEAICRAFMEDAFSDSVDFDAILQTAAAMMQDGIYKVHEPLPSRPSHGARIADDYKGTYTHPFYGPFTVDGSGQGGDIHSAFHIAMGPLATPQLNRLALYGGDTFLYEPQGENGGGQSAVAFASSPNGPITGVEIEHLFEPYTVGNEFPPSDALPSYVADTWQDVYFLDTSLVIGFDAMLRSWTFVALTDQPVALVVYRPYGNSYELQAKTDYVTPRPYSVNTFFTGPIAVKAGDRIGFHQKELGTIAFKLDPDAPQDRGKGNFGGRVWFTPGANAPSFEFSSSTDRTYLIQVEVAWGLRGPGIARRSTTG
ncbi:serine hydrolase [Hyalangium rubrum]|uniref:Serine hydrolase n=1 Tax=Hyalangium rubrum TaxID=3103134 RepID=A0ABU5GWW3_9BACT|nr:serine hydrolase [Hyalangium sp. s54d21]MDY7225677.1 serine hydrolase [Hyalangium sp. s54d21]